MPDRIAEFLRKHVGEPKDDRIVDHASREFTDVDSVSVSFDEDGHGMTLRVLHEGRWHVGRVCRVPKVA